MFVTLSMNIFGSVQLHIVGKSIESTNNIRKLQLKFFLDENQTMQPMRIRVINTKYHNLKHFQGMVCSKTRGSTESYITA